MPYLEHITTNIKSPDGSEYNVDLGQYTLLIGANEAGKSAIAEACQLATTGSAHGLLYRDKAVKSGKLLSALKPDGAPSVYASGTFSNGAECEWVLNGKGRAKHSGPGGSILPVVEIRKALSGSLETQLKFFGGYLCTPRAITYLAQVLPDDQLELLESFTNGDKVDLIKAIDSLGKKIREQTTASSASQIALESLGTVMPVDDEEIKGLMKTLQRGMTRDLLRTIYLSFKADPNLRATAVIRHLTELLGGQDAVRRIPPTETALGEIGEAHFQRRLTRAAVMAKSGQVSAAQKKEGLAALKESLLDVLVSDLRGQAAEFAKTVSELLPEGQEFVFEVPEDGKSLVVGLARDGVVRTALSGSTEARVIAAIAVALSTEGSLVVVDDRMWDADTLGKTLEVLRSAESQVIIMSTIRPKGKQRSGWTYVTLNRTEGAPLQIS